MLESVLLQAETRLGLSAADSVAQRERERIRNVSESPTLYMNHVRLLSTSGWHSSPRWTYNKRTDLVGPERRSSPHQPL